MGQGNGFVQVGRAPPRQNQPVSAGVHGQRDRAPDAAAGPRDDCDFWAHWNITSLFRNL